MKLMRNNNPTTPNYRFGPKNRFDQGRHAATGEASSFPILLHAKDEANGEKTRTEALEALDASSRD